jgi:enhancer of mRNA-decapping protein 3
MSGKYLGSYVTVDCGELFGCYQGQVSNVDTLNQTLTLKDVWKNGLKSSIDDVTLLAKDILSLAIIPSPKDDKIGNRAEVEHLESQRNKNKTSARDSPRKFDGYGSSSSQPAPPDTPNKLNKIKGRVGKDDVCFGTDVNMEKDFDFETNLALFDKKTVMGEIQSGKQQGPPLGPGARTVSNFRHDENVLETLPPTYRQIHLPSRSTKEFLTGTFNWCIILISYYTKLLILQIQD